ncbi:MAG: signal peptidase I [Nocardioides sp.]|uniref:signal peptidase I n=1 Tax=Nocardioides sp. TaxID=35761 RepID=UPI003F113FE7
MSNDGRDSLQPAEGEGSRPSASVPRDTHDRAPSEPDPTGKTEKPVTSEKKAKKAPLPLWLESILLLCFAVLMAVVIKTFLLQAFYIPSQSMEPGLVKDDRILVQKVSYWGDNGPQRGDVVVFKDPGGWLQGVSETPDNILVKAMSKIGLYPTGGHLVKRVIGLPGDTVECCDKKGRLLVNGEPVDEPYIRMPVSGCAGPNPSQCEDKWTSGVIPEGKIWVMGDNRGSSADSSEHMCRTDETDCVPGHEFVPIDDVVGKVFVLLWPADRFDWIGTADAFDDVPDPQ